jgi:hypothetical protein
MGYTKKSHNDFRRPRSGTDLASRSSTLGEQGEWADPLWPVESTGGWFLE